MGLSFEWLHHDLLERMRPDLWPWIYQTKVSTTPSYRSRAGSSPVALSIGRSLDNREERPSFSRHETRRLSEERIGDDRASDESRAVEFLTKPFKDRWLLNAIRDAIDRSRAALRREADPGSVAELCYESLTLARTGNDGVGRVWAVEPTSRRGTLHQRNHCESSQG